jgi:bifunctional UDP-N-acetylglucosamine pyrophosphorylase/glucosamine-1-phosphate N-acetyltransferase
VKRSTIGQQSSAKHLSYIGDSTIGKNVNIGAGTITCNYDGSDKHATTIEDNVFIGSNNTLVAPVTIAHDSFTAAGSVITKNVPAHALAIGRSRQVNKEGYAQKLRACTKNVDVTPATRANPILNKTNTPTSSQHI